MTTTTRGRYAASDPVPRWAKTVMLLTIAALVVAIAVACGGTQAEIVAEPEPTEEPATETAEPEPADEIEPDPEPTPEPEPESTVGEIGDTATMTQDWGDGSSVGTITVSAVDVTTRPDSEWSDAPKHGVFVIFTVELTAEGAFDVYSGDFYVRAEDGTRWDEGEGNSWDAIDYDDGLGWAELNAGERKTGLLVFDLPEAAGELAYAPNYQEGPIVTWVFEAE